MVDDEDWVYPNSTMYQPYMVQFMTWFHAWDYSKNQRFTKEDLLEIRPSDLKRWMADKAYGDPEYNVDSGDHQSKFVDAGRSKGAVSFFGTSMLSNCIKTPSLHLSYMWVDQ